MKEEKQKLLLQYLISSPDTFALCQGIIKPEYFDPGIRNAVAFTKNYYESYNTTPEPVQIKAETGLQTEKVEVTKDQIHYVAREIEQFCKKKAIERAILDSVPLIDTGDYGTIEKLVRDAVTLSLTKNLGLRYFENTEERIQKILDEPPTESTGWSSVDEVLFGGISRKELLLFAANSGEGKSFTMLNLGYNFIHRAHNVLYISLELSEEIIAMRLDTMFTGISRREWRARAGELTTRLHNIKTEQQLGVIDIVHMKSGTTANEIRAFLKEYYLHYNFYPSMLIVDYLDKMSPNEYVSADNAWEKDKRCAEQLRDICIDYNMFGVSASQLNREAVKADTRTHAHIAGGISKINEADTVIFIKMSDVMKASGDCIFEFQKTRNSDGVGKVIHLRWDNKHTRITDDHAKVKINTLSSKARSRSRLQQILESESSHTNNEGDGFDGFFNDK